MSLVLMNSGRLADTSTLPWGRVPKGGQVHGGQGDHQGGVVRAEKGVVFQELLLFHVLALFAHVLICRQQKAAGAAAGIYKSDVFDTEEYERKYEISPRNKDSRGVS